MAPFHVARVTGPTRCASTIWNRITIFLNCSLATSFRSDTERAVHGKQQETDFSRSLRIAGQQNFSLIFSNVFFLPRNSNHSRRRHGVDPTMLLGRQWVQSTNIGSCQFLHSTIGGREPLDAPTIIVKD